MTDQVTDLDRRSILHEAICRCVTCRGTTDKSKLCRICAIHDAEIENIAAKRRKNMEPENASDG